MEFNEVTKHWKLFRSTMRVLFIECGKTIGYFFRYLISTYSQVFWGAIVIMTNVAWIVLFAHERVVKQQVEHKLFQYEQQVDSLKIQHISYSRLSDKEVNKIERDMND